MCGICGIYDLRNDRKLEASAIKYMTDSLSHRGPDQADTYQDKKIALGFSRLSIIDLEGGMQPLFNEDKSIIMICNGEIFNYVELRSTLKEKGHQFRTNTDVEVLVHLYEEFGTEFLNQLNGQFAFAIYDKNDRRLFCARDHFGIIPFFYTFTNDFLIFGSEIKSILQHPLVTREVDLVGLDQILSFPGLVAPRTMFQNIKSLENGHYMLVNDSANVKSVEYWDVNFPERGEIAEKDEDFYVEQLDHHLSQSIKLRLRSDVPIGLYLSGGLDSSIIAAKTKEFTPGTQRHSFSIDFEERDKSEGRYQRLMSKNVNSIHHEKQFFSADISDRLTQAVFHSEQPLKETYNTASLSLSETARQNGIKVVLTGEGSDEFFAGYLGYKFDLYRQMRKTKLTPDIARERDLNRALWGDEDFYFETNLRTFLDVKRNLYSDAVNDVFDDINSIKSGIINEDRLRNRDMINRRAYLDYKLRLVTHLIADHGDRVGYANSVEVRYPFLDKNLVEFAATIPTSLKLKDFNEKYILKQYARSFVPAEIIKREKFAFHAPGSPYLLKRNIEYINDLLSYDRIKKQGYFNPDTIEVLKKQYTAEGFSLDIPYETDLLIIAITFGIMLDQFMGSQSKAA